MELLRLKCPVCRSANIQYHSPYTTKNHGSRVMYKCAICPASFSETKNTLLEGLKTPVSVIWHVLKARTEGMGLNAAARTFEGGGKELCNFSDSSVLEAPIVAWLKSKHEYRISNVNRINAVGATRENVAFDHGCFHALRDKTTLQK